MKKVIIIGSSRKNGETSKVVSELIRISGWNLIDLMDYKISHYDYSHQYSDDDFLGLIKEITENYDVLIFATPVYWYSMSGSMKVFFDRLTDLLKIEKDIGRKLRNKFMAVLSSSNGDNLEDDFWLPFKKSAEYLGMTYIANLHTYQGKADLEEILEFRDKIESKTKQQDKFE